VSTTPDKTTRERAGLLQWLEARINLTEVFALLTSVGLFYAEVDTNKPFRAAIREALAKPMASYVKWPRVLGPLAVLFFLFQVGTGSLLAFYYRPSLLEAHESLRIILRDVNFGWLLHQVHRWGGQLLVFILLARMVRFFFECVYKKPRELLWITSALLFLVATHADFTGRLLTWNQVSYWTTVRGLELLFMLPFVGPFFAFLIGGTDITGVTLSRFYFLHVAILPASILVLFYFSFATVRRVGLTAAPEEAAVEGRKQYLSYLFNILILIVAILGILVSLAVLLPVPFHAEADPFTTPTSVGPPWYLSAAHVLVEAFPAEVPDVVVGWLLLVLLVCFVFWPLLDTSPAVDRRARRPVLVLGTVVLVVWLVLTSYGSFAGGG
jgi:quinol-cytochrome oxidoreductase complex cytochrome b subunit